MTYCLGIDTSGLWCSVSLVNLSTDQSFIKSVELKRGHAEVLMTYIHDVFDSAGFQSPEAGYQALSKIAVITGPGSFTGLRVGLSVARGIALARNIPCVGISNLQALAVTGFAQQSSAGVIKAVINGRGGQIFCQSFAMNSGGQVNSIDQPQNIFPAELATSTDEDWYFVGSGEKTIQEQEIQSFKSDHFLKIDTADMKSLARYAQSCSEQDFRPEPHYLREADAVKAKSLFPLAP